MTSADAANLLALARKHLAKVQAAWDAPTDWSDLTMYGLYAVEAAVLAVAAHLAIAVKKTHPDKRDLAARLHAQRGLPDVSTLLDQLNIARKAAAYGDGSFPVGLDAEDTARAVEEFIDAVEALITGSSP